MIAPNFDVNKWITDYLNKYTLNDYITSKEFKPLCYELEELIAQEHGKLSLKKIFEYTKLFDAFDASHPKHKKYSSTIGMWIQYFIDCLNEVAEPFDDQTWSFTKKKWWDIFSYRTPKKLLKSKDPMERIIGAAFIDKEEVHRQQLGEIWKKLRKQKKKYWFNWRIFPILNEDCDYLELVVNHLKNKVHKEVKDYINQTEFYLSRDPDINDLIEISVWNLDMYDQVNEFVVVDKFQKATWSATWMWQALMHVYLIKYDFDIECKGITIINTLQGEKYSISLSKLFGPNNIHKFFNACKVHIMDFEKLIFREVVTSLLKQSKELFKLPEHEVIKYLSKYYGSDPELAYEFIKHLSTQHHTSLIEDPKALWREWISYKECIQEVKLA